MQLYNSFNCPNWEFLSELAYEYYLQLNSFVKVNGFTKVIDHKHFLDKVPEFKKIFDQYKLNCFYAAFVVMNKNTPQFLHKDVGLQLARLLWPVKNCEKTLVKFYDVSNSEKITAPQGFNYFDLKNSKEINTYELSMPLVVNSTVPHYVHVDPELDGERISLYFMFFPDPIHFLNIECK